MKTIKLLVILLITCMGYNCSDEENSLKKFISDEVEISDRELIIPSGAYADRTVITSDVAWMLKGGDSWCSYEPTSGEAGTTIVNFTLESNPEYSDRSTNITLSAGGKEQTLTVYQKKKDAIILSKDKFDQVGMEGDEIVVNLQTNIEYRVEIPAASSWITELPVPKAGNLTRGLESKSMAFKVAATQDESARVGEIIFMSMEDEKLRDTVLVYQVQRDVIVLSHQEYVVPLEGQTLKIDLRSNVEYEVEKEASWVHVVPNLGRSSRVDRLLLQVDEYTEGETRNCEIIVKDKNNPKLFAKIQVKQVDREIIVIEDNEFVEDRVLTAPREEGIYTLNISDNIDGRYELVIPNHALSWIIPVPETYSLANGNMRIRLTENPIDRTQRMANIFVRGIDDPSTIDTLTVIQAGGIEADLDERRIIYEIAVALGYEDWPNANKLAWAFDKPLEEWNTSGVKVRDGKLVELVFPANANGEIPAKIGELVNLEVLGFGGSFTVAGCKMSGPIPPEIGKLTNLKKLSLKGEFTEFPIEIGALENLEDLTLNFEFYDPLDVIGDLVNLKKLSITTGFAGPMSDNWVKLTKLEELTLAATNFTSIDPLERMVSLKKLSISNCKSVVGALPGGIGYLAALESLSITNSSFSDLCPSMGSLVNLKTLTVTGNELGFIPEDIGGCTALTSVNMGNNKLKGSIPESIGQLHNVTSFYLNNNQLTGNIPASIGGMSSATTINLSNNQLTGMLPASVSGLVNVTSFNLSNNLLTGICEEIGSMFALKTLNLSNNRMMGTVPALGKLTALQSVDLSRNLLSGAVPMDWNKNMVNLTTINLTNNQLEGEIPATLGLLPKLSTLRLDTNKLEGNIPAAIFKMTTLRSLYLQANQLSGELSVDFANLKLSNLDLRDNNFEGSIPENILGQAGSFGSTSNILHLSGNKLTGMVPLRLWTKMKERLQWQIREQQNGVVLAPPPGEE